MSDWLAGAVPQSRSCHHDFAELPADYVYLLGLYLGDGCISTHPRDVYRLRIVLDAKYPGIIDSTTAAMREIRGGTTVATPRPDNCVEVSAYWKCWPCLLPQHGPGKKHERPIVLAEWQQRLVNRWPSQLIRGLINSDGHRFRNTGRAAAAAPPRPAQRPTLNQMSSLAAIRTASPSEREALSDLHRRSSFVWEEDRVDLAPHPEALGVAAAAIEAGHVRVAVDGAGVVLGFCIAFAAGDRQWELDDLFVEPELMHAGVGRALVEDAAHRAIAAGAMALTVIGHPRARGFYERVGFEKTGDAVTRFGIGTRMRRPLSSA